MLDALTIELDDYPWREQKNCQDPLDAARLLRLLADRIEADAEPNMKAALAVGLQPFGVEAVLVDVVNGKATAFIERTDSVWKP